MNEVGGAPEQFGTSLAAFHAHNRARLARRPHWLVATSTHDTKRSEDVRARINVLSEIPREWQAALNRWSRVSCKKKPLLDGRPVPDRNEEYLLYQTLVSTWPLTPMSAEESHTFKQRIQDYMRKATKEAKVNTSWINPNQAYDDALRDFVGMVLDTALFLDDFQRLCHKVAQYGMYNALSQTLLKLTVPGVPDLYQGTELWDFSLVDPDNRRPVDYEHRRRLLCTLQERCCDAGSDRRALVRELLETRADGRIKLYVISETLRFRRIHPQLFQQGDYLPVEGAGARQEHLCAFARRHAGHTLIVAVPRFFSRLIPDPQNASPPGGTYGGCGGGRVCALPGRAVNHSHAWAELRHGHGGRFSPWTYRARSATRSPERGTITLTRRFSRRPFSVAFKATGYSWPYQRMTE